MAAAERSIHSSSIDGGQGAKPTLVRSSSMRVHESAAPAVATPFVVVFYRMVVRADLVLALNDSTRSGSANIAKVVLVIPAFVSAEFRRGEN